MSLTGSGVWGEPADPAEARLLLRRALGLGCTFFDTADSYGPDASERLVAEALYPYPDGVVVATKGGMRRHGPGRWSIDCSPAQLRAACVGSLRRLRVQRIDLYQLHAVDARIPLEESLGTLAELQSEGKVRDLGVCNVTVSELERARRVVDLVSVQNRFNLVDRSSQGVLDACERLEIAFVAWAPLAKGFLTRARGVRRIAAAHGATPAQVALAWMLAHSPVTLPIPGTAFLLHLEENFAALELELEPAELETLERYRSVGYAFRRTARRGRVVAGRLRRRLTPRP